MCATVLFVEGAQRPSANMAKQAVTIYDIADLAKVSQSTVSRVLNGTTRVAADKKAAVLAAIAQLKYQPNVVAQGLARGRSQVIGVVVTDPGNPFFARALVGIERALSATAYHPLITSLSGSRDSVRAIDLLLASRIDALILVGEKIRDERLPQIATEKPLLSVGPTVPGLEGRSLHASNQDGAAAATNHLLKLGHKSVALITGPGGHRHSEDRRAGYQQALSSAGLAVDQALVAEGAFDEESGLKATNALLDSGRPFTAVFASNDQMAYGAMLALHRRGLRVPQDMSVIGYDDLSHSAYTTPPLTTIRQPVEEMGAGAAAYLLAELGGTAGVLPTFTTELIVRESTGPVAQRKL